MTAANQNQTSPALLVDLGKTKTAAAVSLPDGSRRDLPTGPGAAGLSQPDGLSDAVAAIAQVAPPDAVAAVAVGAAGALAAPERRAQLAGELTAVTGAASSVVTSDAITAHLGALGGQAGVVLIAGTGAVAVAVTRAGAVHICDGAGPQLGDRGSGGWLGRAALDLMSEGQAQAGVRAVVQTTLGADWPAVAARTDAAAAAERGRLVPGLAELWREGDAQAAGLFDRAANELAATVRDAIGYDDAHQVALLGGLGGLGPRFVDLLGARVPGVTWLSPKGDALDGAALLLTHHDLPHETVVSRSVA
ncbi:BadF/BadG/BcrA/BcrD ATPase family protein [Branchiibius sp. NY16-3462-2]|uniref:BadF/BadG/BcrA/BcrD ATPase family protein n=1 Tax=Branchiibius sp. NY16-3462-2 TaxID=1807500 RepID=UPI0007976FEB|nr:BadF/BadG/BcrA/BcrD ATPase family protein [Branchiibius sp. NY16-3462-2]KYH45187.1 hypothetical protein AZH51_15045 [Branchiibius sp. NY16-3462-2]